jgi:hypothetical protein
LLKYFWILFITIFKSKYDFLLALSLEVLIVTSVLLVTPKSVIAQTIEIMKGLVHSPPNPQIKVCGQPNPYLPTYESRHVRRIAINEETNKIYIVCSLNGPGVVVSVLETFL